MSTLISLQKDSIRPLKPGYLSYTYNYKSLVRESSGVGGRGSDTFYPVLCH